jgi:glucose-6-phosphate 1-dehydrogenase
MTAGRLLVLGASGDLVGRYLLRALAELYDHELLPDGLDIVGVARDDWDDDRFRSHAAEQLEEHADDLAAASRSALVDRLGFVSGDVTDPDVIASALTGAEGPVVAYMALPPAVFEETIDALVGSGLADGGRIVVEKPFGASLSGARSLNALLLRHWSEQSVFRMDHFLGKQTVQNLLGLRFANRLFEPLWCAEHIESVEIVWDESIGLEGRAGYYDSAGALVDMIQNHLLQLLALVAMERPSGLDEAALRDAEVEVLRSVRRLTSDEVDRCTVRGRYGGGKGGQVTAYVAEEGVDPERGTETFADVTLFIDNDRWSGVPFRLRTGKALDTDRRQVRIRLRATDSVPFRQASEPGPNMLTLTMDPDRLVADIALNGRGDPFDLEAVRWELELAPQELSAYARLLHDVIEGDHVLSIRGDAAEECWRIVEPIVEGWGDGLAELVEYPAGTAGPTPV